MVDGAMMIVLREFESDAKAFLAEHAQKVKSLDNPRYCLNYGDLGVSEVSYRVHIEGDVTLCATIEEGRDDSFDGWMTAQLQEKWGDRNYCVEIRSEW